MSTYVLEAHYPELASKFGMRPSGDLRAAGAMDADGWLVVALGGRDYCVGYMDGRRDVLHTVRPAQRVRRIADGRVVAELPRKEEPSTGLIFGFPRPDQHLRAALKALGNLGRTSETWGKRLSTARELLEELLAEVLEESSSR